MHAASAQVAFRFNSFIGLAIAERLAGAQGLLMIAVLIGVCVPLFNVAAVWPMARHGGQGFVRELLRNPLIIATASGLVVRNTAFDAGAAMSKRFQVTKSKKRFTTTGSARPRAIRFLCVLKVRKDSKMPHK